MKLFRRRLPLGLAALVVLISLCPLVRAAEPQWVEVRSPHFTVLTDAGEKQGREVALRFEQMRNVFGTLFQRARINLSTPLEIVAFRNSQEMKPVLPLWKGKAVENSGYYQPGADRDYIVLDLSAANVWHVVFHEYGHLLLGANYPATAPWFDEGFAEYYATTDISPKEVVIGRMPEGDGEILTREGRMPLVDLFRVTHESGVYNESGSKRGLFYAQSWLVVHYLMDKKLLPQTGAYFELVRNQHVAVPDAIRQAYGMDAKQMDRAVYDYSHSGELKTYTFALPSVMAGDDYKVRKLEELDVRAALADLKLHSPDHFQEAVNELEAILRESPNQAAAHRGLGYAYLRQGDYRRAGEHFQQASEIDPNDARVLYYAALLMNRESLASGQGPADPGTMKLKLDKALDLDPDFADAWNLLAIADLSLQDPKGALEALKKAIQLNPREEHYQLNLALFYMQQRRWEDANGILVLLKDSSDPEIAAKAAQSLALLDAAKTESVPGANAATQPSRYPSSYDAPQWRPEPGQEAPDVSKPIVKTEEGPPDTRAIQYLKGRLVSVDCSAGPGALLRIEAGGRTLTFRTPDRTKLVLIGADTLSCQWRDRKVTINYKRGGQSDGDLVSLELE